MLQNKYKITLIIFFVTAIVYISNLKTISSGDTIAAAYLPVSILKEGNLDLDEFRDGPHQMYSEIPGMKVGKHYLSYYPIGTALLALPFYAAHYLFTGEFTDEYVYNLEKYSASLIVAFSAVILFLTLTRLCNIWMSLVLTFIYAFGTSTWSTSSQGMWQHTSSQFSNCLVLYFLVLSIKNEKYIKFAGLCSSFSIICRPTNVVVFVLIGIYVVHQYGIKKLLHYLSFASVLIVLLLSYNLLYYHNLFAGYSVYGNEAWKNNMFTGITGLLFSPSRGLFIYSPVLLFSITGFLISFGKKEYILLKYSGFICICYVLIISRWNQWWGGWSYGPRLLTDILPFMMVLMVPIFIKFRDFKIFKATAAILIIFSVWVQIAGAYFYNFNWDANDRYNTEKFWKWKDSQLLYALKLSLKDIEKADSKKECSEYYSVKDIIKFNDPGAKKYFGNGWSIIENWGAWAVGKESVLFIHIPKRKKVLITMEVMGTEKKKTFQEMEVYFNNNLIKKCIFSDPLFNWNVFKATIPGKFIRGNIEELKFIYKNSKRATYMDTRDISVGFKYIKFEH